MPTSDEARRERECVNLALGFLWEKNGYQTCQYTLSIEVENLEKLKYSSAMDDLINQLAEKKERKVFI